MVLEARRGLNINTLPGRTNRWSRMSLHPPPVQFLLLCNVQFCFSGRVGGSDQVVRQQLDKCCDYPGISSPTAIAPEIWNLAPKVQSLKI